MEIIEHQIEEGRHSANQITEIRGWTLEKEFEYTGHMISIWDGDGFYFWDETEAVCTGPYKTKELAVEARDLYFGDI